MKSDTSADFDVPGCVFFMAWALSVWVLEGAVESGNAFVSCQSDGRCMVNAFTYSISLES